MVQKYQNEISPIFYYEISTKTDEKDLKIPNLQPPYWKSPYWMTLYYPHGMGHTFAEAGHLSYQTFGPWSSVSLLQSLISMDLCTTVSCHDIAGEAWPAHVRVARLMGAEVATVALFLLFIFFLSTGDTLLPAAWHNTKILLIYLTLFLGNFQEKTNPVNTLLFWCALR